MAKKISIFLGFAVIIAAFGFLGYAVITSALQNNAKDKMLVSLTYKELDKKIKNNDTFILVITQTQCSHCAQYKPVLKEVLYEYDITAYEIDQETLTDKELGKLKNIANISGTPTTVFIVEGEEQNTYSRIKGAVTNKKTIIKRLKAQGYITEEKEENKKENNN